MVSVIQIRACKKGEHCLSATQLRPWRRAADDTMSNLTISDIKPKSSRADSVTLTTEYRIEPSLGVSVKSVHLVAGRLGFYSQSGHTKDFKNSIRSFRARRSAQAEVRRVLCMCCSSCMFLNSVQSFVIENCNGPTFENGLNNVCLHPLSRTFTFNIELILKACLPIRGKRQRDYLIFFFISF